MPRAKTNEPSAQRSNAAWQLRLLGQPALVPLGGGESIVLQAKDAALLAVIALSGPVKSDRLAALLWPGANAKQADTNLRQRLFRLRRRADTSLVETGALLRLADSVQTDLAATLQRIDSDEQAGVLELLGDHEFEDLPELNEWARAERRRWREQRDAALAAAASRCEKDGAIAKGLAYAQRMVDSDPLAEHAQRRLMRLHYLRGDRAAAIAAFERFEQRLKDELGTRPSAETIELMATIERGGATLPARRAVAPASLLRPPRLIGRESELRALQRAWAGARAFLLLGEAGIGKSRLLNDFAAGQAGVVAIKSRPGDGGVAYAVLARLLRAVLAQHAIALSPSRTQELALLLPELGTAVALSGAAQRLLLQRTIEAGLADAMALGLHALVVDDLHFTDDASIDLLQSLIEADGLAELRWGLAQRPAEASRAAQQLRNALEEAQRVEVVALAPLNAVHLAELVESLGLPELDPARLAPALLRHSGGNPLFALETLRDLVLSGEAAALNGSGRLPQPPTVSALVERRLMQLSPPALKLARVAALAGTNFSAELAAAVLELHPLDIAEPWRELETAQVIRDGGFAHDLILDATRASVPAPIGELLHERIARHLQSRGSPSAIVAPHWAGATLWLQAGEAYAAAAQQAQSASQRTHEVQCWNQAAACFERAGAAERAFQSRCSSVPALIVVQGVAPARGMVEHLLEAAQTDNERASALIAKAMAALMAADHAAGIDAAQQAGKLARRLDAPWLDLEAGCLQAVGLSQAGRAAEALAIIEPYRSWVEREGSAKQRGRFWADYAYALNSLRRLRDTAFALQQAIVNAQELGDLAELATLTSNLATVKGNLGHVDEALTLAHRALAIQTELGAIDGPEGGVVHAYVGLYSGLSGRYREALEHLDAAIACFTRDKQVLWTAVAANHRAQFLADLGQFARARQALEYERPPVKVVHVRGAQVAARIDRALGQPTGQRMQAALDTLGAGDDPHVHMQLMLDITDDHDPRATLQRCDEALQLAHRHEFAGVAMKARLRRAHAQSRAGQTQDAALAMRELVEQMTQLPPADMYFGEAWWIAAQVFDANGDGDHCLLALARGAQWVRRVALPNVPEEFRDSFLTRNPVNRALLAAADRRTQR
jgi:DNA-binding SARP family transcriptional activator